MTRRIRFGQPGVEIQRRRQANALEQSAATAPSAAAGPATTSEGSTSGAGDGPVLSQTSPNDTNPLLNLPFSVQRQIFSNLNHPSSLALRRTCTHFRSNFTAADTAAKAARYREELHRQDDNSFPAPCYTCLRLLPILAFDSAQPTHSGGPLGAMAQSRRCVKCCLSGGTLTAGAHFWQKGVEYVNCARCRRIGTAQPRFGEIYTGRCGRCAERAAVCEYLMSAARTKVFQSLIPMVCEVATAIGLAGKLRVSWAEGSTMDRAVYGWALFSVVGVVACNVGFIMLVSLADYGRGKQPGQLNPATPSRRYLRRLFRSNGGIVTAINTLGVALIPWAGAHLFVTIGMGYLIRDVHTVPLFCTLLFMNTISIIMAFVRCMVEPFENIR